MCVTPKAIGNHRAHWHSWFALWQLPQQIFVSICSGHMFWPVKFNYSSAIKPEKLFCLISADDHINETGLPWNAIEQFCCKLSWLQAQAGKSNSIRMMFSRTECDVPLCSARANITARHARVI
jgi:hypothetical protein